MHNKDLLLSYLLIIPAIFFLLFFISNFWIWVTLGILLLIYPIIYKLLNRTTIPIWTTTLVIFLVVLNLFIGLCIGYNRFTKYTKVAVTDDIKKANEIENIISSYYCDSIRLVDGAKYTIALKKSDKRAYREIVLTLINSNIVSDNVNIILDTPTVFPCNKSCVSKLKKNHQKELSYLINGITGVFNSEINFEYSKCFFEMNCDNPYVKANVKIDTSENFDTEEIKELTQKLLLASIYGLTKDNIHIEFNIEPCENDLRCDTNSITKQIYKKAKYYYRKKDYSNTIKYLEKAKKIDSSYTNTIEDIKKIVKLDKEINKNPNNYKLYIQRGDMENVFKYSCCGEVITSDYYAAIADYTQALKLNPKAYEVYERRGDAYSECGYQPCTSCKLLRTQQDDENTIKDYELAIKYTGGNDKLYEKLGDRYIENNPQKALSYYNKVKNIHYANNSYRAMPEINAYSILSLKIVHCYSKLNEYDKALDMLFKISENCNNKELMQEVNNLRFYYNWKAKHYKSALKSTNSCSIGICKIVGVFF